MSYLENDAMISDCGKYRYLLRRTWDRDKPSVLFVMLNPSTADAEIDDPTIRSCVRLSKSWGSGAIEVVNIFAWRATNPLDLFSQVDPIGPKNNEIMFDAINRCDVPICAWGASSMVGQRASLIRGLIERVHPVPYCLGTTKSGAPKHPLYIKSGTALEAY